MPFLKKTRTILIFFNIFKLSVCVSIIHIFCFFNDGCIYEYIIVTACSSIDLSMSHESVDMPLIYAVFKENTYYSDLFQYFQVKCMCIHNSHFLLFH